MKNFQIQQSIYVEEKQEQYWTCLCYFHKGSGGELFGRDSDIEMVAPMSDSSVIMLVDSRRHLCSVYNVDGGVLVKEEGGEERERGEEWRTRVGRRREEESEKGGEWVWKKKRKVKSEGIVWVKK